MIKKKRRVREPFIVISEWKGVSREETRWHFSKEDIQKDIDKMIKNYHYHFSDNRSSLKGNPNYNPTNYKLIDILPYPKRWSVLINNGDKEYDTMTSVNAQTEKEARQLIKKQYPAYEILEIKQGVQIIM